MPGFPSIHSLIDFFFYYNLSSPYYLWVFGLSINAWWSVRSYARTIGIPVRRFTHGGGTRCVTLTGWPRLYLLQINHNAPHQQRKEKLTDDDDDDDASGSAVAGSGSGALRQACIRFLPSGLVTKGCSLGVVNVYTSPVSDTTRSKTWVPVKVLNSYA